MSSTYLQILYEAISYVRNYKHGAGVVCGGRDVVDYM